jgi:NhaP-type Na+/H+ or K+/H+ antiporter
LHGWELAVVAAVVVAYAAVSGRLTRTPLTPAIFFVTAGLLAGSEVLGWIDLDAESSPVRLLAEATLTLVLFADASRIDFGALRQEYAVPLRLLGIGLPLTIVLGALVAAGLIGELSLAEAAILAIVLAPTDAALGQAVVTDPRLPSRIRQGLNVESGLNDGICVPLLFIAIAVAEAEAGTASNLGAVELVLEQIGYGVLGGVVAGALGAAIVRFGTRRNLIEPAWIQILTVGTAGLAYGLAAPIGGSGFIAAFVGGFVFGLIRRSSGGEVTYLLDEAGELLNGVTFVVFGAVILGAALVDITWETAVYAVLSLTVVRMLPVAVSLIGTGARRPTVAYTGWFGPRGLASIVFGVILVEDADLPHTEPILLAIALTIGLSVFAHGLSAQPLTERYVGWYRSHPRDRLPTMESKPAPEHRWRWPAVLERARPGSPGRE